MPRYFFDFDNADGSWPDEDGSDLSDPEAARSQAVRTLAEMAKDIVDDEQGLNMHVRVRVDDGSSVFEARMTLDGRWMN